MQVQSLGQEDPLQEGMATHSSILALEISFQRSHAALLHSVPPTLQQASMNPRLC